MSPLETNVRLTLWALAGFSLVPVTLGVSWLLDRL